MSKKVVVLSSGRSTVMALLGLVASCVKAVCPGGVLPGLWFCDLPWLVSCWAPELGLTFASVVFASALSG